MLWNQDMTFPDTVRAHHLKAKETKKVLNPYEAVAKRKKDRKEKEEPAPAESRVIWNPVLPAYSPPIEDSGASMGAKGNCTVPVLPPAVMHCLSYTTKRCFDGFSCTYRRHPWMALLRLTLMPQRRRETRRQIICSVTWIPSFLFHPRARVLLAIVICRNSRTHKQQKAMKVCLHDTACAWREVPDLFDSLSHSTAMRFVSTASTGEGGEGWRKTSSVDFAVICTRDSIKPTALRYKVYLFLRFS